MKKYLVLGKNTITTKSTNPKKISELCFAKLCKDYNINIQVNKNIKYICRIANKNDNTDCDIIIERK